MYGGDVYNQNASAAGVTYNCGGEIPTLFPGFARLPSRGFRESPTDLVPSSCHANRLRVGGRASSRGHRHLPRVRLPHPVQETHETEYVHGIPDFFCFPFESPLHPARVFPARPLPEPSLTVPSPIFPPQSSNSRRDERSHGSRRCAGLRRERSRRVCKRTNEAFALSKNLSNVQQVFR